MMRALLTTLLVVHVIFYHHTTSTSTTTWNYYNGSCFSIPESGVAIFDDKKVECTDLGGYLVEIDTQQEMDYIRSYIDSHHQGGGEGSQYWVGLGGDGSTTDPATYSWTHSGQVVDQSFWMDNEPGGTPRCVRLRPNNDVTPRYELADQKCNLNFYEGICEKFAHRVPSVATPLKPVTKYTRTPATTTWPLCRGDVTSRQSRVQCATWCSSDVTCVGFEFYNATCQLVTLEATCWNLYLMKWSAGSGYFHNVDVRV